MSGNKRKLSGSENRQAKFKKQLSDDSKSTFSIMKFFAPTTISSGANPPTKVHSNVDSSLTGDVAPTIIPLITISTEDVSSSSICDLSPVITYSVKEISSVAVTSSQYACDIHSPASASVAMTIPTPSITDMLTSLASATPQTTIASVLDGPVSTSNFEALITSDATINTVASLLINSSPIISTAAASALSTAPFDTTSGIFHSHSFPDLSLGKNAAKEKFDISNFVNKKLSREMQFSVLNNVFVPESNFNFPVSIFGKSKRSFVHSWLSRFPGLVYSPSQDCAYCLPCSLFHDF